MQPATYYHLDNDLDLPKITLRRWLSEHSSRPGQKKAWDVQRALLSKRTRAYTGPEVRSLLKLGEAPYEGRKGIAKSVLARSSAPTSKARKAIVARVKQVLKNHKPSTV